MTSLNMEKEYYNSDTESQINPKMTTASTCIYFTYNCRRNVFVALCVWACLVTFVAFPLIGWRLGKNSTLVEERHEWKPHVKTLVDGLAHSRQGDAILAEVLRELNQSHVAQGKLDVQMDKRLTEAENDVKDNHQSYIEQANKLAELDDSNRQSHTELENKITGLNDKLSTENTKLNSHITDVKNKLYQINNLQNMISDLKSQVQRLARDSKTKAAQRGAAQVHLPGILSIVACISLMMALV